MSQFGAPTLLFYKKNVEGVNEYFPEQLLVREGCLQMLLHHTLTYRNV